MRPLFCLVSASLLLAAPAGAQADEDSRELRRQTVAGWTVVEIAESDGGRLIELRRRGRGIAIRYLANFWRGNGGELRGALVQIGDCASGDRETLVDPETKEGVGELRARFASYFEECRVPARRQAALLRGVDDAYCLFQHWAAEAAADTALENLQIAVHGTGETVSRPRPDYPACRPPR